MVSIYIMNFLRNQESAFASWVEDIANEFHPNGLDVSIKLLYHLLYNNKCCE